MTDFTIRFFICNIYISGIIVILLTVKRILKHNLSGRMQYNLWFLLLGLLSVPFFPFRIMEFPPFFSWLNNLKRFQKSDTLAVEKATNVNLSKSTNLITDFTLSINSNAHSVMGCILFGIWILGMIVMLLLIMKSSFRINALKKSALPLQNPEVCRLYHRCLDEIKITKDIPVYSTVFLKSPVIIGILKPCIYMPTHLISDYNEREMRYMLLHELQHCKHRDAIANYLMNLAKVIYWFNPVVWYALKEMRSDREIACDSSVLNMLEKEDYEDYGNALINHIQKVSFTPFPFAAGIGGSMKQIKKRIMNIASYEKPTFTKKIKGIAVFVLTAALLLNLAPFISTYAAQESHYQWKAAPKNISYIELSDYFKEYDGCFVLYDLGNDSWSIYNMEHATLQVSPDSTYKIYDALFGLEEGVITLDDSMIEWNGEPYPFDAWNTNQTLQSAIKYSVNWYFQKVDEQLGTDRLHSYIRKIGYGNKNISGDFSSYWMESSLKISPIEQVELLIKLYNNDFDFAPENINAIKDAICLSTSNNGAFYGKTGTGRVDGQDINGWFAGFVETADNAYFFATNITAEKEADGSNAAEITLSVLSDMGIWSYDAK